jgi:hypothetical protein
MRRWFLIIAFAVMFTGAIPVAAYGNPVSLVDYYPCPDGYPIKGNTTTYDGELIYHVPSGDFYNVTNPEQCFATEQDAIDAGYRRSYL